MSAIIALLLLFAPIRGVVSDFSYPDFNNTAGLVFNGAAGTTDCDEATDLVEDLEGDAPNSNSSPSRLYQQGRTATTDVFSTVETARHNSSSDEISVHEAGFGHRVAFEAGVALATGCSTRLRLTPSHPSKAGSVWYESRVPVLRGFEARFRWQVSDHSVECTEHADRTLSRRLHRSCAVRGGDGFAFVLHGDPADADALGGDGENLGYGGISNSLAVEFDAWTNVDAQGSDDVFQDHISVHAGGPLRPNGPGKSTALGYWRAHDVADGKVHEAKVQYLPYVEPRYFELMTANDNLLPYLKDNGEGRRLGTLAVFVDQGIVEDRPLLAMPVNLSLLMDLPDGLAYVGFTASTGRKWEKHDVLDWEWCDDDSEDGCWGGASKPNQ
ncbi:hypothetical protein ACHAWF_010377 [Thalassiosira exigua]